MKVYGEKNKGVRLNQKEVKLPQGQNWWCASNLDFCLPGSRGHWEALIFVVLADFHDAGSLIRNNFKPPT